MNRYKQILKQHFQGTGIVAADAASQKLIDELEQCETDALNKLPYVSPKYQIGDMVWITGIDVDSSEYDTLIRKPVKIVGMRPMACSVMVWTLDLEDCPYLLTEDDVKPV